MARSGRFRGLAALGAALALEGIVARVALGIAAVVVLGMVVTAVVLARNGAHPPLEFLPSLAATSLAWSAGILIAFASASRGLRQDRERGIFQLTRLRGGDERTYLWGRTLGLALVLLMVVGGGVLLSGAASTLAARTPKIAFASVQATVASLFYALGFAVTIAPVALAALGARSRAGGYLTLAIVLFIPDLFVGWTENLMPEGWNDVLSIPSALSSLRASLMPESLDPLRFVRAAVVIAAVTSIAMLYVRRVASRAAGAPAS